ncbi:hypothetical protein V5O48_010512 [Marasmius crinis-equi]|uniref:Uncharacterized protein n=1 Tax=Marasmius crinis-equi TaxID=585013 RepID=A0ABR3F864_9AGAR
MASSERTFDVPVYLHPRMKTPSFAKALYLRGPWLRNANQELATKLSDYVFRLMANGRGRSGRFPKVKHIIAHMGERLPSDFYRIDRSTSVDNREIQLLTAAHRHPSISDRTQQEKRIAYGTTALVVLAEYLRSILDSSSTLPQGYNWDLEDDVLG